MESSLSTATARVLVVLLVCGLLLDLSTFTDARPQKNTQQFQEYLKELRILQEIDNKYGRLNRPRLARSELPANYNDIHSGLDKMIGYFILEAIDRAHSSNARPRFGKRDGPLIPAGYPQDEQEDDWQNPRLTR
ncbi:neuropeptide F-like [Wyeomyia smithii]|uniref:neuropeptide F-like n=1 Tax=Wyeomyia smithii TaxID=174621 RepID=UPI002467CA96|nr:neuropeptide F-like [Wyeomyia smithii]